MPDARFKIFRGDRDGGELIEYQVPIAPGMVVLDAIHYIQANQAPDLAVRWNCKAGKCGSCSAEVNGRPRLTCKTRMDALPLNEPITVQPMKSFPVIRDLVTDVSWNYRVNRKIPPFTPRPDIEWKMYQRDVDRVQEFRKCIECFLCQNVCHVLRDHEQKEQFGGPRFFVRIAGLEMKWPAALVNARRDPALLLSGREHEVLNLMAQGRSNHAISILLSGNTTPGNCTVTICHSQTKNIKDICLQGDIIIAAIGIPEFVKADMVKSARIRPLIECSNCKTAVLLISRGGRTSKRVLGYLLLAKHTWELEAVCDRCSV